MRPSPVAAIAAPPTQTTVRGAIDAASRPVTKAAAATPRYPADSFRPSARPRRFGPTRSIFITTVIDQARPWLAPRNRLATTTKAQLGARPIKIGTGRARSQPSTSSRLRPTRSASVPAPRFISAFDAPKATTNVRMAVFELSPKSSSPISGSTVRSRPTIAPTSALIATSNVNWPAFARRPSRTVVTRLVAPVR